MKKSVLAVSVLSALLSTASLANETYIGAGLSTMDFNDDLAQFQGLNFKMGQKFGDYVAVEAKVGLGMRDESIVPGNFTRIDNYVGLFVKAGAPVTENVAPYVIAGHTTVRVAGKIATVDFALDESDYSYGVGVDFTVSESTAVNLEVIRHTDIDWLQLDVLSLGVTSYF